MLTPREARQAKTRQQILDAALAIVGEEGADKLSLRALATRVQYSPAGLYAYFDGKDAIIDAVCEEGDQLLRHYLRRVPTDLLPGDYFVELGQAYIQFALDNEAYFMLMFARVADGPPIPYAEITADETYGIC